MKWFIVVLFVAGVANAKKCADGMDEWQGDCVVNIAPYTAPGVRGSDEKPPADKMPSWQREGITVIDAPNMQAEDARQDREKAAADQEGKKKAGIK